jgi:hypothetical protein
MSGSQNIIKYAKHNKVRLKAGKTREKTRSEVGPGAAGAVATWGKPSEDREKSVKVNNFDCLHLKCIIFFMRSVFVRAPLFELFYSYYP